MTSLRFYLSACVAVLCLVSSAAMAENSVQNQVVDPLGLHDNDAVLAAAVPGPGRQDTVDSIAPAASQSAPEPAVEPSAKTRIKSIEPTVAAPETTAPTETTDPLASRDAFDRGVFRSFLKKAPRLEGDETKEAVIDFYRGRRHESLWTKGKGLSVQGEALIKQVRSAPDHGLKQEDYLPHAYLTQNGGLSDWPAQHEVELDLTLAYLALADDLASGAVDPMSTGSEIYLQPKHLSVEDLLERLDEAKSIPALMASFAPKDPSYAKLQEKLKQYRQLAARKSYTRVPSGKTLRKGDVDARVPALKRRLSEEGFYKGSLDDTDQHYDGDVVEAVKAFQRANGLSADGVAGRNTFTTLNISLEQRVRQIEANLERLRWYDYQATGSFVDVNIADQTLKVVRNGLTIHQTRVVVGKPKYKTPIFSHAISYAEVNPTWTIPRSIALKTYLPMLQRDPTEVMRRGIRVFHGNREIDPRSIIWSTVKPRFFNFTLQQRPGRNNALGGVKYMFPNRHAIYLHDTPSKHLFSRSGRAFSHGCIRVENPFDFGDLLFKDEGWDKDRLMKLRSKSTNPQRINLSNKVPVHLRYFTAFVDAADTVQFRFDIYGNDARLIEALETRSAPFS